MRLPLTLAIASLGGTLLGTPTATGQTTVARTSELRDTVVLFRADRRALSRRYDIGYSTVRRERMRSFFTDWRERLEGMAFEDLGPEARIDWVLLANEVRYQLELLDREERTFAEMRPWLPFATTVMDLEEARRRLEPVDPADAAAVLAALAESVDSARQAVGEQTKDVDDSVLVVARRSAMLLVDVRRTLERWHDFYAGYDPLFTWWTAEPFAAADSALDTYLRHLNETVLGARPGEPEPLIGDPIGAGGLESDLTHEMIPYTVPELLAIAEREFAWCEAEYRRAARDMGYGDDWRAALETVKRSYVAPGEQPRLIAGLAREAIAFLEERDLITIPPMAAEVWRMEMMSPERQRVSPFFLGGEVILVSYPTDRMSHEEKLMSMRGNNPHFSRATVHHELIPGHHLQGFMTSRHNGYRSAFSTPFWTEGWALYWEMLLWDLGFPRTPEDRIGMLFWRSHRAARIIFSLRFHLGQMTPVEAVDFLVDRVGHERANAEGEVRRSVAGDYPPLYQAAYMLGGLQFRALHRELVASGGMTDRAFHDAILRGGTMPVAMVRARLAGDAVDRNTVGAWRFAGDPLEQ